MKLSQLIELLKDCKTDPELFVGFEKRPVNYKLIGVEFQLTLKNASLSDFNKLTKDINGPKEVILVAHIPQRNSHE